MKLTLIYGREGSGKSTYIDRLVTSRAGSPAMLIVPDQYTHQTELDLINRGGLCGLTDTEVLSFKRLSHRLKLDYGGASVIMLSDEGKTMLINRIISNSEKIRNGALFANTAKTDVAGDIAKLISRFKQYEVSPEMLEGFQLDRDKYAHTMAKLSEITEIYKAYTELAENSDEPFFDNEDDMALLCRNIEESRAFAETDVYIDGFDDIKRPELSVIEALIKTAKSVTVTLPVDAVTDNGRRLLFNRVCKMSKNIESLADRLRLTPEKIWFTDETGICPPDTRLITSAANRANGIAQIERCIFSTKRPKGEIKTDGVYLVSEPDITSEAEHVADKIVRLVRDKGIRYNDIAVIVSDEEKYKKYITSAFKKRNIPYFMDIKRSIRDNAIIAFIVSLIDVAVRKRGGDSVISLLKTGLLTKYRDTECESVPFGYLDIAYLERYAAQYYIRGSMWDKPFKYGDKYFDIERLNELRERVLYYIAPFEEAFDNAKTAREYARVIENYIEELNIRGIVNENIDHLINSEKNDIALEYSNIWNVIARILGEISEYMGDTELGKDEFRELIRGSFDGIRINLIPASVDQVAVTGTGRTTAKHIRALFVLGAGSISVGEESGLFSMAELDMLKSRDIDIGADSMNVISDEQYYIYRTLSKPTDELYISMIEAEDELGATVNPVLINALNAVFGDALVRTNTDAVPYALKDADNIGSIENAMLFEMTTLAEKSDEYYRLDAWLKANGGEKYRLLSDVTKKGMDFTLATEQASPDSIIKARNGEYIMDISRLERYAKCPYQYFAAYCLKPNIDVEGKVSALDVGNLVHGMLDLFTKTVMRADEPTADDVIKFMDENFDKAVLEYETDKFNSNDANKYVLKRTRAFLIKMMTVMAEQRLSGSTVIFANELPFDDSKKQVGALPSVDAEAPDGTKFKITGKIDCVEYAEADGSRYWIVSDYKTGRNPSNADIRYGRSLQLPMYMFALLSNDKGSKPGAMFYVGANDDLIRPGDTRSDDIAISLKKKYGKVGMVAENQELYMHIDSRCKDEEKDKYDILSSASIARRDALDIVNEDELLDIVNGVIKTAGDIFGDIKCGMIPKRPINQRACEYCEYKRFCGYDPKLKNGNELESDEGKENGDGEQ